MDPAKFQDLVNVAQAAEAAACLIEQFRAPARGGRWARSEDPVRPDGSVAELVHFVACHADGTRDAALLLVSRARRTFTATQRAHVQSAHRAARFIFVLHAGAVAGDVRACLQRNNGWEHPPTSANCPCVWAGRGDDHAVLHG